MKKLTKGKKTILALFLVAIAFITCSTLSSHYQKKHELEKLIEKQQILKTDEDIYKRKLQEEYIKVERLERNISNKTQLIVLSENGVIDVFHDKTPENNKYIEWLIDSNIRLYVYYTAILSIPTDDIFVFYNEEERKINISYDLDKINVSAINIDNITSENKTSIFGQHYSSREITALTLIATDRVKEEIAKDDGLTVLAKINLETYLRNLAYSMGVVNVSVKER